MLFARRSPRSRISRPVESLESRTLFSAGDLDPTFGLGGHVALDVPGGEYARTTAVGYANGRVVLGGVIPAQGAQPGRVALAVLDAKGNPVKSFSGDGIETELVSVPGGVLDMAVQADNKIVVLVGSEPAYGVPPSGFVVARITASGTLDTTFGGGDGQVPVAFRGSLALGPGGKIFVAGAANDQRIAVARFTAAGAADGQFVSDVGNTASDFGAAVFDLAVTPDGRAVVAGTVEEPRGGYSNGVIVRFRADLAGLDTSFGSGDGVVTYDSADVTDNYDAVDALAVDGQGRTVAAVRLAGGSLSVRRLLADGAVDPSFAVTRYDLDGAGADDVSVAADGKVIVSGEAWYNGNLLLRLNPNGGYDTTFGHGDGILDDGPYDDETVAGSRHVLQPDGRIISGGGEAAYAFDAARHVADNATPTGTVALGADGVLRVTGTDAGRDLVDVHDGGGEYSTLQVTLNHRYYEIPRAGVTRIEIATLGGDDVVTSYRGDAPSTGVLPRRIDGGAGNDQLAGGHGNDTVLGMDGNDRLFGDFGDDLIDGGLGSDVQDGGAGADTVDYSFRGSAVFVDLQGDADDGTTGERDTVAASIEHILGGRGNDTLTGDDRPNFIRGNGGNDTIRGGGGNDNLVGDAGQDKLYGDAGDDFLDARDGITDLVLDGGSGFDKARKDSGDPRTSIEQLV